MSAHLHGRAEIDAAKGSSEISRGHFGWLFDEHFDAASHFITGAHTRVHRIFDGVAISVHSGKAHSGFLAQQKEKILIFDFLQTVSHWRPTPAEIAVDFLLEF